MTPKFPIDEGYRCDELLKEGKGFTSFDEIQVEYSGSAGNPLSQSVITTRGEERIATRAIWGSEACFLAIAKHRKIYSTT